MNCRQVAAMCDAYIDGELDPGRTSAVRGHARDCAACHRLLADTARLREEMADFEPIEPPPGLWQAIGSALADAERADARRSTASLWWERMRPKALPAAVGLAGAFAVVLWWAAPFDRDAGQTRGASADLRGGIDDAGAALAVGDGAGGQAPQLAAVATLQDSHAASLADADAVHREVVRELEALYESEREHISPTVRKKVDQALSALAQQRDGARVSDSLDSAPDDNPAFAGEAERRLLRRRAAILQAALVERPGALSREVP